MKQTIIFTLTILLTGLLFSTLYPVPAVAAGPDGKAIFLAQKCNLCHSVPSSGITRAMKSEKTAGPDLVNLKGDATYYTKYLRQQVALKGKKHGTAFPGSDKELSALVAWIKAQRK